MAEPVIEELIEKPITKTEKEKRVEAEEECARLKTDLERERHRADNNYQRANDRQARIRELEVVSQKQADVIVAGSDTIVRLEEGLKETREAYNTQGLRLKNLTLSVNLLSCMVLEGDEALQKLAGEITVSPEEET